MVIHLNKRRVYKVLTSKHYRSTNPGQFKHCEKNGDFQNELRILSPALFNAWYIKYITNKYTVMAIHWETYSTQLLQ